MPEDNYGLKEKAIAAYEASALRKQDLEEQREAIDRIQSFLNKCGVVAEVKSNPFEIDGISFYGSAFTDVDGKILGYNVSASRPCSKCGVELVLQISEFKRQITIEEFGRWLSLSHLCEFEKEKPSRTKAGFVSG
jgi:hypothetical protein